MTGERRAATGFRGPVGFWVAMALCLVWAGGGAGIAAAHGWGYNRLLEFLSGLGFLWAGVFALWRRPRNVIGALLLGYGVIWFAGYWSSQGPPIVDAFVYLAGGMVGAMLLHIGVAFPTGRAATRFGRIVIVIAYCWNALITFADEATLDRAGCDEAVCRASLSQWLWASEEVNPQVKVAIHVGTLVLVALATLAIAQRWRLSSPAQRRDLRPLWITLVILGGFYLARALVWLTGVGETWGGLMDELGVVAQLAAPVMIVYGMLRAGLTTSAVGDLFGSFPADPRSLEAALARTLQDPTLRLVSRAPDGQWRDGTGSAVELPSDPTEVTHVRTADGEPQAALVHDRGLEPSAVSAAAAVVGLLLENQSLSQEVAAQLDEVQASRARIVEAGYRERRRVERDLHDGAQQRLLSVALALRMAQREVEAGSQAAPATIAQANDELRLAIDELRELARGIHPSILTDAGLGAAVRALAGRCPVPVDDLHLPDGRFPTGVEATAYFVVAEALTNIAKHAQATTVGVRIEADDAWLRVTITDDGVGGASPALGTGLRGLRDRVEAAGGALQVTSPAGAGTTITAELPIREEES